MMLEEIKTINDLTGQILRSEDKVSILKDLISDISEPEFKLDSGAIGFSFGKTRRNSYSYPVTKDEILIVLKRILTEEKDLLRNFLDQLSKLT